MANNKLSPQLYLASASPRRRELLDQIGVTYQLIAVDVDESLIENEAPETYVARLAISKAQAGAKFADSNLPVLGADTIVVQDQHIFGKPKDKTSAMQMWQALSGREHQVITAVAIAREKQCEHILCRTQVQFSELPEQVWAHYWASGEPCDKAGGYAIQGKAAAFIESISGSYSNVVGLPLYETTMLLKKFGINIF